MLKSLVLGLSLVSSVSMANDNSCRVEGLNCQEVNGKYFLVKSTTSHMHPGTEECNENVVKSYGSGDSAKARCEQDAQ